MADLSATKVLVTQTFGYLGLHCIKQLLDTGYSVRSAVFSSVLSVEEVEKIKYIGKYGKLELVEVDLNHPDPWKAAVKGVDYIIYVASPYEIATAIEDVENLFDAAAASDSVIKRIVFLSSYVTICEGHKYDANKVFSEEDWADLRGKLDAYGESKTLAEKAAWDFVRDNKGHPFELAVINQGSVFGPLLSSHVQGTSASVIEGYLLNDMPVVPRLHMPFIDVRDCAKALVLAMTIPEAAGHRHICVTESSYTMMDMGNDLAAEFQSLGYPIRSREMRNGVFSFLGLFSKRAKKIAQRSNQRYSFDKTRMRNVLGMTDMISPKRSVIEMAHSMIQLGHVERRSKYREPAAET